jgi:pullulanase
MPWELTNTFPSWGMSYGRGAREIVAASPQVYTLNPPDVINYISSHDNQTLFDNNQYKIPMATTMFDRVRVNNLGMALVGLAQGIPFFHAGDDILRSKSFDNRRSASKRRWIRRLRLRRILGYFLFTRNVVFSWAG